MEKGLIYVPVPGHPGRDNSSFVQPRPPSQQRLSMPSFTGTRSAHARAKSCFERFSAQTFHTGTGRELTARKGRPALLTAASQAAKPRAVSYNLVPAPRLPFKVQKGVHGPPTPTGIPKPGNGARGDPPPRPTGDTILSGASPARAQETSRMDEWMGG